MRVVGPTRATRQSVRVRPVYPFTPRTFRTVCSYLLYMNHQHPIAEPLWNTVPAEAQAALLGAWNSLLDRIPALEAQLRDLQARLQLNYTNSSKPPSSDPIGLKRKPPTPPSRRKRGGQPGHPKAFRPLVPPEKLRSSR